MEGLTKLQGSRKAFRSHRTRIYGKVEALDLTQPLTEAIATDVTTYIEQMNRKAETLRQLDAKISSAIEDVSELEQDTFGAEGIQDTIIEKTVRLKRYLEQQPSTTVGTGTVHSVSHTSSASRLPKLVLPTFAGEPLKWQSFWDSFEAAVHLNNSLTDVEKFNYLRAQLEGEAARTVSGFTLTNTNYEQSVTLLKARFGQPQRIVNAHMQALLDVQSPSNTAASLRQLHDTIEIHIRGLESLGKERASFGDLLVPIVFGKLPPPIKRNLTREHPSQEWNIDKLRQAIEKEIIILESGLDVQGERSQSTLTGSFHTSTHKKQPNSLPDDRRAEESAVPSNSNLSGHEFEPIGLVGQGLVQSTLEVSRRTQMVTTSNTPISTPLLVTKRQVGTSHTLTASVFNDRSRVSSGVPHLSTVYPPAVKPHKEISHCTITTTASTIISTHTSSSSDTPISNVLPPSSKSALLGNTSTILSMLTSTNVLSVPVSISSNTMVQSADAFTKVSTTAESTALLGCTEPSTANNKNDHRLQRSPEMDYIPDGWRSKMSPAEQQWIGEALFKSKNRIKDGALSTLWWYPPPVKMVTGRKPQPDVYAMHRLCVWMPLMAWNVVFKCPTCRLGTLTSKGVYKKTIRSVVDYTNHYYLTTEELQCNNKPCEKTFLGWDERLLSQLSTRRISQFPAILTKKRACDVSVVACLRDRTLGNSSTALYNRVQEQHTEEWMKRAVMYYADCEEYSKGMTGLRIMTSFVIDKPLPIEKIGGASWFLKVYAKDILRRLPQILATCTAVFGSVLKIDSTKKVCRKLQGRAAGTASWCTNVGNERGEILTSVLTESEGLDGLRPMAVGLIRRYEKAKQDPPKLLYTDRDCCSIRGRSHCAKLFNEWENLVVRLDIWHYMRRLSRVCTSESYPIYGKFMASLSDVIFEWDEADYSRLCDAKRGYLKQQGISQPSVSAVKKAITKDELSRHCRRKTRGVELTIQLIEELLLKLGTATDSVGVPLFNEDMTTIWEEQKKHVPCIQDPPGMCLYTITGYIMKGGVRLPVYRCSRGTTSLESFHLHLARFIPGTSASDVHFQVYLLEGLSRWNQARERAAVQQQCKDLRTFNLELAYKVNRYSLTFHSSKLLPHHHAPMRHHEGEYFGVEYLFRQAGGTLPSMEEIEQNDKDDEDATEDNTDEGFVDENGISPIQEQDLLTNELNEELAGEQERDDDDDDDEELDTTTSNSTEVISSSAAVDTTTSDTRGIPGWDKVGNLAKLLTELTGIAVSTHQAGQLKALYDALDDYDKQNIKVHLKTLPQLRGRFCRKKRPGNTHEELMSRSLLSGSPSPLGPKESRIVEAVCILLCQRHLDAGRSSGSGGCRRAYLPRWKLVLKDYNAIRSRLYHSWGVLEETNLALYHINRTTLRKWYQDNVRMEEVTSRLQGIQLPTPPLHSAVDIPAAQEYPVSIRTPPGPEHEFSEPEETLRQVRKTVTTSTNTGAANTNANPHLLVTTGPVIRVAPRVLCRVLATSTTNPTFTSAEGCTGTQLVPVVREVEVAVAPRTMSKTCEWREKRRQAEAAAGLDVPPPPKRRRPYCCAKCGQVMNLDTGHTQFHGIRYCPNEPGQISMDKWLEVRRKAHKQSKHNSQEEEQQQQHQQQQDRQQEQQQQQLQQQQQHQQKQIHQMQQNCASIPPKPLIMQVQQSSPIVASLKQTSIAATTSTLHPSLSSATISTQLRQARTVHVQVLRAPKSDSV